MIIQKIQLLFFSVVIWWSIAIAQHNETIAVCSDSQFFCQDAQNSCVPKEWMCDNVKDCSNGKDEADCRDMSKCPPGYLRCRNYACVTASLKCDGADDCLDGSDEIGCPRAEHATIESACSPDMFQCRRGLCIPESAVCDENQDCPDGDDEEQCPSRSENSECDDQFEFKCKKDNFCILKSQICDGASDCSDGSDERNCQNGKDEPVTYQNNFEASSRFDCMPDEFRCSGREHKCIPLSKLCNKARDCPEGDDEGGRCGMCSKYGCEHSCIDSPLGPICLCGPGEEVGDDLKSCVDVNECLEYRDGHPPCAHTCTNTKGSFTCSCNPGSTLAADGRGCNLEEPDEGRLFASFGQEVRVIPLTAQLADRVSGKALLINEDAHGLIIGLDYSPFDKRIYMMVSSENGLHGSIHAYRDNRRCIVDHLTGINNVAVDWITGNIYYTAGSLSRRPGVGACRNDGRFCRLLVNGQGAFRSNGLALHPRRGLMFWSTWGRQGARIEQSSMSGEERRTLIKGKLEKPFGLAMDIVKEELYFTDSQLKTIERIDIFTGRRTAVVTVGLQHPLFLALFEDRLFWTDWNIEGIVATTIGSNESDHHVVRSKPLKPQGLAVYSPGRQQLRTEQGNPCEEEACSHLCLLTSVVDDSYPSASCACPDDYFMEDDRCMPLNETERHERSLDKAPKICSSLLFEYCKDGTACYNGGKCLTTPPAFGKSKMPASAVRCECPPGFVGHYCEVALNPVQTAEPVVVASSGCRSFAGIILVIMLLLVN